MLPACAGAAPPPLEAWLAGLLVGAPAAAFPAQPSVSLAQPSSILVPGPGPRPELLSPLLALVDTWPQLDELLPLFGTEQSPPPRRLSLNHLLPRRNGRRPPGSAGPEPVYAGVRNAALPSWSSLARSATRPSRACVSVAFAP